MAEYSWFHDGLILGDAVYAPFSASEFADFIRKILVVDQNNDGVIGVYANNLQVIDGGGNNASVNTGAALVYGRLYENTASINIAVAGNVQYWLIRVRYDILGVDPAKVRVSGSGPFATRLAALADLTHSATYWDIPLATVLTDAGGNVDVVTDERQYVIRGRIKREFIPAIGGSDGVNDLINKDPSGIDMPDADISYIVGHWRVPDFAFVSNFTLYTVITPAASGNTYISQYVWYAACNEHYDTHTDVTGYTATAVIIGHNNCVLPRVLTSISGGDFLHILLYRDGVNVLDTIGATVKVSGWLAEYVARF